MDLISYDYTDVGDNPNKAFIFIHGWQGNKDSFKSISKILNVESCRFYLWGFHKVQPCVLILYYH